MHDSHASRARSSEEVDMRLLQFRRGTESVAANAAPALLGAIGRRPLRVALWRRAKGYISGRYYGQKIGLPNCLLTAGLGVSTHRAAGTINFKYLA